MGGFLPFRKDNHRLGLGFRVADPTTIVECIQNVPVHALPAKHEQFDKHPQKGYPYLSYLIDIDGVNPVSREQVIGARELLDQLSQALRQPAIARPGQTPAS